MKYKKVRKSILRRDWGCCDNNSPPLPTPKPYFSQKQF